MNTWSHPWAAVRLHLLLPLQLSFGCRFLLMIIFGFPEHFLLATQIFCHLSNYLTSFCFVYVYCLTDSILTIFTLLNVSIKTKTFLIRLEKMWSWETKGITLSGVSPYNKFSPSSCVIILFTYILPLTYIFATSTCKEGSTVSLNEFRHLLLMKDGRNLLTRLHTWAGHIAKLITGEDNEELWLAQVSEMQPCRQCWKHHGSAQTPDPKKMSFHFQERWKCHVWETNKLL